MASDTRSAPERAPAPASAEHPGVPLRLRDGTPVWLRSTELAHARDECAEIVADLAERRVIGRVSYRRVYGPRAVLTLAVDDRYWPLGLSEALIGSIGPLATAAGISKFLIRIPASDDRMLALLVDDFAARCMREGSYIDAEIEAPDAACGRRSWGGPDLVIATDGAPRT